MSSSLRDRLFGTRRYAPPAALAEGARFSSDVAYHRFLNDTLADPGAFWLELSSALQWSEEPDGVGGPGDWFPGGRLNLTVTCLDAWIESDRGTEDVLVALDGEGREHFSRDEILSRVGILAERLRALEYEPGQRVLLAIPRGYELLTAVLATLRLGLTCVPLDPSTGQPGRIVRRAEVAGCRAALTTQAVLDAGLIPDWNRLGVERQLVLEREWERDAYAPPAPVAVGAMHPAFILADAAGRPFSLPTVGMALHGLSAYRYLLDGRGRGDLHWFQTPAHHASFLTGSLGALISGGGLVTPLSGAFSTPERLASALEQVKPRVMVIQAKILRQVIEALGAAAEPPRLAGPSLLAIEGVSVTPTLYQQVRDGLFDGQTHVIQLLSRPEASGFVAGPHPGSTEVQAACAAWPAPGMELGVVDQRDQVCLQGRGGVLALGRIPPGLSTEMQSQAAPIKLGIKARMDQTGRLWAVAERKVDRKVKERVSTTELEAAMLLEEDVDQVAVIAYRTDAGGLQTRAFVKSLQGQTLVPRLRTRIAERFGEEAVPDHIQIVGDLPYSRSGKLLRSVLRRIASDDAPGLSDLDLVADREVIRRLIDGRNKAEKPGGNEP